MEKRSGTTMAWSLGIGWLGALAIGAAGFGLVVALDLAVWVLDLLGHGPTGPTTSGDIQLVTVTSMVLCLAVAAGGGWTLAGAPEGLTPRWLAGVVAGLLGVAVGATAFAAALHLAPF
jgi:hypothetical protein